MNYWPAESGNLSEFHLPMIRLIQGPVEPGRKTARSYFNAPGWVCAYTANAFGWTSPGYGLPFGPFFGGSAWDCQHLWEHYAFSRSREYLKGVYPTLKEACEFNLATLVPDEKGLLVTSPSVSPENSFRTDEGVRGSVCEGAAAERQVIWDLFTNTIQAARVLMMAVSCHGDRAWSWYQDAQRADTTGPLAGVPYDGLLTRAAGKGLCWEGLDPQDLYAQYHPIGKYNWQQSGNPPLDNAFVEKFFNRTIDLIDKYQPDLL